MKIRTLPLAWGIAAVLMVANGVAIRAIGQSPAAAFDTVSYRDSGGFAGGGTGKSLSVTGDGRLETLARGGPRIVTQLQPPDLATLRALIGAVDWTHVDRAYRLRGAADLVVRDLVVVVHGTTYETHADSLSKLPPPLQAVFDRLDEFYKRAVGFQERRRFERDTCLVEGAWARGIQRDCGWLVVPESRERPKSNVVRLAVEVIRAREPDGTPPLVLLHGGPGGQGGIRLFSAGLAASPVSLHRDVVIYDQRGAGLSQPKLCPSYERLFESTFNRAEARDKERILDAARRACVQELDAKQIDRLAYSTSASAADLIDLRHALGYARWDIYGPSYGALLAQEVMDRDAAGIRAVVLASPVGRAIMQKAEQPQSTQRAFERVFEACGLQPRCRAAFPQLGEDFYAVYDALNRSPLLVPVSRSADRHDAVVFNGERLVADIRNRMLNRDGIGRIPLLVHELRSGDRLRAAREVVADGMMPANVADAALREIVLCNDGATSGSAYRKAAKSVNARSLPPFRRAVDRDERECREWLPRVVDRPAQIPVRSDIPTLILTGYFDDRAPTDHGRRIAATLSRVYVVELPDEGHDARRPGPCHAMIVQHFYEDPTHAPDTTCIAQIPSIQFATSWNPSVQSGASARFPLAPPR